MKTLLLIGALAILGLPVSVLAASPLDGSKPMLCAVASATDCTREAGCVHDSLEGGDEFWRINVEKRTVATVDGFRSSPINGVERKDGQLVLQGTQEGRAWNLVLDEETGRMFASVTDPAGAHVLAGSCTVP